MAKSYTLEESAVTGWWVWSCGLKGGSATNKDDAEAAAKKACGDSFVLTPPPVDAQIYRGHLAAFTVQNLERERVTFSAGEVSEDLFQYLFGFANEGAAKLKPVAIVVALLKIWGIYRGGDSEEAVRNQHALSADVFGRLAKRKFGGLKLAVANDGKLKWSG